MLGGGSDHQALRWGASVEERVGNNREHGLKGEKGSENDNHGNKRGENRRMKSPEVAG